MSHCALAALLTIAATWDARGSDEPPEVLSRGEITEGWIALFDGHSAFGWTVESDDADRSVSIADGVLTVAGPASMRTNAAFGASDLRLSVRREGEGEVRLEFVAPGGGPVVQSVDLGGRGLVDPGRWTDYNVRLTADGVSFQARSDDGTEVMAASSGSKVAPVRHHVALVIDDGATVSVRGLALRPLGMEPIFNGRDLAGWVVLPGGESVYSVTEDGHLNVKDGRGDLQTEAQYDDFILQLDVFVNGEHLNSGIFFRTIRGEFWSGYESQIRNEWEDDDRTRPVDFGTGAIYRRQPARRVVSDDFEWFTKTIVAADNHLAVWVDGYLVTDWTDDRPPDDNARNGRKDAPGPISIQGHDPTTDLSFRNLRIVELPGD